MQKQDSSYASDFAQLRDIESGVRFEPYTRLAAVCLAGVLIYVYTGWVSALIWPIYFVFSSGSYVYYLFVHSIKSVPKRRQVLIAAALMTNLQFAFAWLPTMMTMEQDRGLMVVGACLLCSQLLFLVRRSESLNIFGLSHKLVVVIMSIAIYIGILDDLNSPVAYIGVALALIGLNYYFVQTLRISRFIRQGRENAAQRAHQAQKMAAIGQLAGGVAHDFNNNLTAIIGSLELIQVTNDPKAQKQDVENALMAARQAATTVKQLMIFARMEKTDSAKVKLQDVFFELTKLTKRLVPTSVKFEISTADPDIVVRVDRHQLITGLINLIVNSVDAMPQGGSLKIRANVRTMTRPEPLATGAQLPVGEYAQITISDTGHGIAPDLLGKVLDPFFTTKPVGKGTGLGLSMVVGMMQEFDGGLAIKSDSGGTQIILFLPTPRQRPETVVQTASRRSDG